MAILGNTYVDLIDIYKQQDPKGEQLPIIEQLMELTPFTQDAVAVECNKQTTHLHGVRTGLPPVTWGKMYKGIPQGKSTVTQVEDTTGFVEGLSTIDKRLLQISKNQNAVRLSEAKSYLESMAQECEEKIFYANSSSNPDQFMGLAPRFNDLSATNGNQIIDAGGTGSDNTSVWFVAHGDNQCQLLYPQGTKAGVVREDKGEQKVYDEDNNPYWAMEELFTWHIGLAVKDWRYVSRVANIDVSDLEAGSVDLYRFMRKAYYRLHSRRVPGGKLAIYCNRDILEALDGLATNSGASDNFARLTPKEVEGEQIMTYRGIPIRETDSLMNTEARVT